MLGGQAWETETWREEQTNSQGCGEIKKAEMRDTGEMHSKAWAAEINTGQAQQKRQQGQDHQDRVSCLGLSCSLSWLLLCSEQPDPPSVAAGQYLSWRLQQPAQGWAQRSGWINAR